MPCYPAIIGSHQSYMVYLLVFSTHRKDPIWQLTLDDNADYEIDVIIQRIKQRLSYPEYLGGNHCSLKLLGTSCYFNACLTVNEIWIGLVFKEEHNSSSLLLDKLIRNIEYFCGYPLNEEAFVESPKLVEAIANAVIREETDLIHSIRKAVPDCKPASSQLSLSVEETHYFSIELGKEETKVEWAVVGRVEVHNPLANDLRISLTPRFPLSDNSYVETEFDLPLGKYELTRYGFKTSEPPLFLSISSEDDVDDNNCINWQVSARWRDIPKAAKLNKCKILIPLPSNCQPCPIFGIKMNPPTLNHRAIFNLDHSPRTISWAFGHLVSNSEFSVVFRLLKGASLGGAGKVEIDMEGGLLSGQDLGHRNELRIWQVSSALSALPDLELTYRSRTDTTLCNLHIP